MVYYNMYNYIANKQLTLKLNSNAVLYCYSIVTSSLLEQKMRLCLHALEQALSVPCLVRANVVSLCLHKDHALEQTLPVSCLVHAYVVRLCFHKYHPPKQTHRRCPT